LGVGCLIDVSAAFFSLADPCWRLASAGVRCLIVAGTGRVGLDFNLRGLRRVGQTSKVCSYAGERV
jgi:hypothetical protein